MRNFVDYFGIAGQGAISAGRVREGVLVDLPLFRGLWENDEPAKCSEAPVGELSPAACPSKERDPLPTDTAGKGSLDFTQVMTELCGDIVARCPCFHHINQDRIVIAMTRSRKRTRHGLHARLTPMRFEMGSLTRRFRGKDYTIQRYYQEDREILYIVTFCLPRFLNLPFMDKMVTIFHELYHISPAFDGDLRRHGGRYCVHTHSQKEYDRHMTKLVNEYLAGGPDPALFRFLKYKAWQLHSKYGKIVGRTVPVPRLIPVK